MEAPSAFREALADAGAGGGCDLVSCPRANSSLPLRNGRPDLVVVRERQGPVADDLARFMTFAGHDQNIALAKLVHGRADGLSAVSDLAGLRRRS